MSPQPPATIRLSIEVPGYATLVTGTDREALQQRLEEAIGEVLSQSYLQASSFHWHWPTSTTEEVPTQ